MFGPPSPQFIVALDFDLRTTRAAPLEGIRSTMIDTLSRRHWSQPSVSFSQPPRMSVAFAEMRIEADTSRSPLSALAKTSGSARAVAGENRRPEHRCREDREASHRSSPSVESVVGRR